LKKEKIFGHIQVDPSPGQTRSKVQLVQKVFGHLKLSGREKKAILLVCKMALGMKRLFLI